MLDYVKSVLVNFLCCTALLCEPRPDLFQRRSLDSHNLLRFSFSFETNVKYKLKQFYSLIDRLLNYGIKH